MKTAVLHSEKNQKPYTIKEAVNYLGWLGDRNVLPVTDLPGEKPPEAGEKGTMKEEMTRRLKRKEAIQGAARGGIWDHKTGTGVQSVKNSGTGP
ncbi:MAG: hypothetical protein LBT93_01685 [Treponema sp.]|nr:hypothetical protein [Treponema sp.]